jgi:hypothetical protein
MGNSPQHQVCPQCGQHLLFGTNDWGKTLYCPNCETPLCLARPDENTHERGATHPFLRYVCASLLGAFFILFGTLLTALLSGIVLQILMPAGQFPVPLGQASPCVAVPLTLLFFMLFFFPFVLPAAMTVGVVTQAISGKAEVCVRRIFTVCAAIDIVVVVLCIAWQIANGAR